MALSTAVRRSHNRVTRNVCVGQRLAWNFGAAELGGNGVEGMFVDAYVCSPTSSALPYIHMRSCSLALRLFLSSQQEKCLVIRQSVAYLLFAFL